MGVHMVTSLVLVLVLFVNHDLRICRVRESWNLDHSIKQQQWAMNTDSYCIQVGIH